MKQVNKTMGNHFEEELCELLAEQGFWAHNLAQNQVGQPADVLAVRDNIAVLIDCKEQPIAYDYVDCIRSLQKSFKQRCTSYRKCGCEFIGD